MSPDPAELQQLLDREQIRACLLRYTRGLDRHDTELTKSAFHPDAIDTHGYFEGGPQELADWANFQHAKRWVAHQHYITNTTIDLDGDEAHTETYALIAQRREDETGTDFLGARYVDRFERRDGDWRIARRVVTLEWVGETSASRPRPNRLLDVYEHGHWDGSDVSYERPLSRGHDQDATASKRAAMRVSGTTSGHAQEV